MAELEALEERRAVDIRHARFNAALVASFIHNAHRGADVEPLSPFDFIAGMEQDPAEKERETKRKAIKRGIAYAFMRMQERGLTAEQFQVEKAAMIERMVADGVEDPAALIREVFPEL